MDQQQHQTSGETTSTTRQTRLFYGRYVIETTVTQQSEVIDKWIHDTYIEQSDKNRILVGLDAEWKPTFKKGQKSKVAILQICTQSQKCLIIQLIHMSEIPTSLREFLIDSKCLFMGVDIGHDIKKLKNEYGLDVRESMNLSKAAQAYLPFKLEKFGLVELASKVAMFPLHKAKNTCMSNWENWFLTDKQIEYASLDAFASLLVGEQISLYIPGFQNVT